MGPRLECPEGQVCANLSGYPGAPAHEPVCVWGKSPCDAVECDAFKSCTTLTISPPEPNCE